MENAHLKTLVGECHEDMMINTHKRSRIRGESKLKVISVTVPLALHYRSMNNDWLLVFWDRGFT